MFVILFITKTRMLMSDLSVSDERFVTEAHVSQLFSPIMSWWVNTEVPLLKHTWSTESLLFKLELATNKIISLETESGLNAGMHFLCI